MYTCQMCNRDTHPKSQFILYQPTLKGEVVKLEVCDNCYTLASINTSLTQLLNLLTQHFKKDNGDG